MIQNVFQMLPKYASLGKSLIRLVIENPGQHSKCLLDASSFSPAMLDVMKAWVDLKTWNKRDIWICF
jgi:hypothetical protein